MDYKCLFWSLIALFGVIWSLTLIGMICYRIGKKVGKLEAGGSVTIEEVKHPVTQRVLGKMIKPSIRDLNLDPVTPSSVDEGEMR